MSDPPSPIRQTYMYAPKPKLEDKLDRACHVSMGPNGHMHGMTSMRQATRLPLPPPLTLRVMALAGVPHEQNMDGHTCAAVADDALACLRHVQPRGYSERPKIGRSLGDEAD